MTGATGTLGERLDAAGVEAVSFDLFGTLVTVEKPPDPGVALAEALEARGVDLPANWDEAYRTAYTDADPLEERPLSEHVLALFEAHADEVTTVPDAELIGSALFDAFDTPLETRPGAAATIDAFADHVPVGVLSNSSVVGLVDRTIERSTIPAERFAVVRSSVDIGWRKPHERAFETIADDLGVSLESLLHVGDDARTDGGAERAGGHAAIVPDAGPLDLEVIGEAAGWPP